MLRFCIAAAAFVIGASAALANGATSERRAGGLVFKKSDTIGIASEELYLSVNEVRVSYIYHSKAPATQNVTISFPMPEVPLDDGPDTEDAFMNDKVPDPKNYMNFVVRVDGKPVATRMVERALLDGKDVSERLRRAGVPLLLLSKERETAMAPLSDDVKKALVAEGLLDFHDVNGIYTAKWNYQVLFEWEQGFRPGQTKVDIRYRPIGGDSEDYGDYFEKGEGVRKYCADPAFRAALGKRRGSVSPVRIGYVLKTARFWNGPIGKFRLVVDKGKPTNLVAFCPADSRKISNTQFEWTATNFSPDRDMAVVFFVANEQP